MSDRQPLLFELGTEELPASGLLQLAEDLRAALLGRLQEADLSPGPARAFATPRRLAVLVEQLATIQPEQTLERRGPSVQAAYSSTGVATRAAEGFARSCGVSLTALETVETDKGAWLVHRQRLPGQPAGRLLPALVTAAVAALPLTRRMRWGAGKAEFARPVHWAVLLLGSDLVATQVLGLPTGRSTYGHRFHHPHPIELASASDYLARLKGEGYVIADFRERRSAIKSQVETAARQRGGEARISEQLLDEVTGLLEWPVAVGGDFDPRFLRVPHEALITTMQDNQRYFPVVSATGKLLPSFVTVANIDSRDPTQVRRGNERVIHPRFADAEFFWLQDLKIPLAARLPRLGQVTFEQGLGSLRDKADRLTTLAGYLAPVVGANPLDAARAAQLCKCDLVSAMVFELPELQGVMGRYYAQHDGEPEAVSRAIEEHYLPRHAGDRLPHTPAGRAVALADRLDTLVGIFATGKPPSGNRDPFGLRRAALGIIRILLEDAIDLDLLEALNATAAAFPPGLRAVEQVDPVFRFVLERLRGVLLDAGARPDEFDAVEARRPTRVLDFQRRLRALRAFRQLEAAASLAAAHKRLRNILRRAEDQSAGLVDRNRLQLPAERQLAAEVEALAGEITPLVATGDYVAALTRLSSLRQAVDDFFDQVLVMSEDPDLRRNRLALLASLEGLFLAVADISRLQD